MARKALAAFSLFVTLLQVRASVDCYEVRKCGAGGGHSPLPNISSVSACCLEDLTQPRSYVPTSDASACHPCIVIGFSPNTLEIEEQADAPKKPLYLQVLSTTAGLAKSVIDSKLNATVQVNRAASTATLGSDFKFADGNNDTAPVLENLMELFDGYRGITVQALNDDDTGEIEHFVVEVTSAQLHDREKGQTIQVFAGNSMTVDIIDDDIIHVGFDVTEYVLDEENENLTIGFSITEKVPRATHFIVRPMTYKDYDGEYPDLLKKYPDLKPYTLTDEYDEAELEDFNSTAIHFTIPKNSTTPDRDITINVVDDDLVESREEGFRLLLEVDESRTRRSEVIFGRQTALFRIDNTDDEIEFGFVQDTITINDTNRTIDRNLKLHVVRGRTEFPILISFSSGDRTTAELGVDFKDFSPAQVTIDPPNNFDTTGNILSLTVYGDDIFEPEEYIEATLDHDFPPLEGFRPSHINETTDYKSVVDRPLEGNIKITNKSVLIVIQEGISEIDANVSVPKVVREGESFRPRITVSHRVNATFSLYSPDSEGTAEKDDDYLFARESVTFGPASTVETTNASVVIERDNLVEPSETFKAVFEFSSSPNDIKDLVNLHNPNETITILDENSAMIGFMPESTIVSESEGMAVLKVAVMGDRLADNTEVRVQLSTSTGTADESDFTPITDMELVFNGAQQEIMVTIQITDDDVYEDTDMLTASLVMVYTNANVAVSMTPATISITNDDPLEIGFKDTTYTVTEDQISFSFEVDVKNSGQFAVPITFTVTDTGAEAFRVTDYSFSDATLELLPGHSSVQDSIDIVNDEVLEPLQETFTLTLQTSQPLVSVMTGFGDALVTITDNDNVTIGFRDDMYFATENTSKEICVDILQGSLADNRDVTVMLESMDLTATASEDYKPISEVLVFTHVKVSFCVNASIYNDPTLEENEVFIVTLSSSDPSVSLEPEEADVNILHSEDFVMVGFKNAKYVYDEADKMAVVEVVLEGEIALDVIVSVEGGPSTQTAIGPNKVVFPNTTVTFTPDGPKQHNVSANIVDDEVALEDDETFKVDLALHSPLDGVLLGPHRSAMVTIEDNDKEVMVGFKSGHYVFDEADEMAVVEVVLMEEIAVNVAVFVQGGPSMQTTIGTDRVVFPNTAVTFTPDGPKEQNVSTTIIDDKVGLEDIERVNVDLKNPSPSTGVKLGPHQRTVVTIEDNEIVEVSFEKSKVQVDEGAGTVEICVQKNFQTIPGVTVDYEARDGTATAHDTFFTVGSAFVGSDYILTGSSVTIPKNSLKECFDVYIVDDTEFEESNETFFLDLIKPAQATLADPSTVKVVIHDDTPPPECILSDNLVLKTFSTEDGMRHNFNISEGCERQLVTSCDDALDLEIRVDFFKDNFSSTEVAIIYNGATVMIKEDLSLVPPVSPIDEIVYQTTADNTSVTIEQIMLVVSRSTTEVTVFTTSDSLSLAGLCGSLKGVLYFPKCKKTASDDISKSFIDAYQLKPSDQILRGERTECGVTTDDTVVGDPLMTVPIYAPGYPEHNLHLCYEIHGAADEYFNFVSDSCTSVNAHYVQAPEASILNIIDSMSIIAIDNQGVCQRISVDVSNCSATVDGDTLLPMPMKGSTIASPHEKNGISVRAYTSRVRISVPNCADNSLVMWVICQRQPIQIPFTDTKTSPIDMIKFEITRGLNLKETSHGLIGQFWNIPVEVIPFTGAFTGDPGSALPYYTINVTHPLSEPRSFTGFMYELSWEFESKQCLYVGNNQGGPIGEVVDPNDSVIEGVYEDYITEGAFETDFEYAAFRNHVC